jgi:UDP-2,3-diacylglucosamine pyrophosphatase LpxH
MKKVTLLILAGIVGSFLSAFTNDQKNGSGNSPLNNGAATRNEIVVISDLHMGADLAYAEINQNLKPLEAFLKNVKASPNVKELVIAGDLFDEWFVPADVNTYKGRDQSDFVKRIASANKGVVDALNSIIGDGKIRVTYVPGNHDLTISPQNIELIFPGINQTRDEKLGLGTYTPADFPALAIEHGHRYNLFCAPDMFSNQAEAPGTIMPPGYFFTRIAALHVRQKCKSNIDMVPVVTPNPSGDAGQASLFVYWKIWNWAMGALPINNHFNEPVIVTGVNGFTGNYSVNDLLPYQSAAGAPIDVKLFNGFQDNWEKRQTANNVAVHIPLDHAIAFANSADETDNQAIEQYFKNPASDKRIVVFGHNHRATIIPVYNAKGLKSVYANSGTWIDHNPTEATATFIVITKQSTDPFSQTMVEVYNYENEIYTVMTMNKLRL